MQAFGKEINQVDFSMLSESVKVELFNIYYTDFKKSQKKD
jgi:hypothetical protein